ncbi:hypothetical protein KP803_10360 [Vibrio sp. ZSDE26]|uniref:Uncharacterized protein n=1 Tax=Vibrio amylolyticus TaxID=2847292 RepID=A0A9X2BI42_9VIBR|nr:hypothetical protein [Vibrio amylolyticus]MCK6263675.1 hypothetical protein [Vibrio amylolyticus]
MSVTPIEIQTASICLDIAAFEEFHQLTEQEVREYLPSIQDKIWEHEFQINYHLTEGYVNHLAERAVDVLLTCRRGAPLYDATWVFKQLSVRDDPTYIH